MCFKRLTRIERKLDLLLRRTRHLTYLEEAQMADLSALTAAVEANASVVDSAVLLINDIAAQLAAAATDPAAVQALADELTTKSAELAAAIQANTTLPEPPVGDEPVGDPAPPA